MQEERMGKAAGSYSQDHEIWFADGLANTGA